MNGDEEDGEKVPGLGGTEVCIPGGSSLRQLDQPPTFPKYEDFSVPLYMAPPRIGNLRGLPSVALIVVHPCLEGAGRGARSHFAERLLELCLWSILILFLWRSPFC